MAPHYQDQRIVIIGLGVTGLACVHFFLQRGASLRVMDTRLHPPQLKQLPAHVEHHLGDFRQAWLLQADLIVISPGVSLATPALQQAKAAGVPIVGDIEIFCREVTQPIVAITGSNGKSTVTTLVAEMARCAGIKVGIGGNIGIPVLSLLPAAHELYVIELSSFQLESVDHLPAAAATILNLTADHQDRYPDLAAYCAAKQRIYRQAACCVVNRSECHTHPLTTASQHCRSFGAHESDYHLLTQHGEQWLAAQGTALLPAQQLKLQGGHNQQNALAAIALAEAVAIPRSAILAALQAFEGLPHRFQPVWRVRGITWINDSKATNVGSTLAALQGLPPHRVLHLLLGGESKGTDFSALVPALQREALQLYCFGAAGAQLAALRPERSERTETLAQAMQQIAQRVAPGDLVLLSPACASFDQFSGFEQRGQQFTQLAQGMG